MSDLIFTFPVSSLGGSFGYQLEDRGVPVGYACGFPTEEAAQAAALEHERRYLRRRDGGAL